MIQFTDTRGRREVEQTIKGHEPIAAPREAELERLGDEIAELAAHLHAATYQLLVRLRDFDERNGRGRASRRFDSCEYRHLVSVGPHALRSHRAGPYLVSCSRTMARVSRRLSWRRERARLAGRRGGPISADAKGGRAEKGRAKQDRATGAKVRLWIARRYVDGRGLALLAQRLP